MLPSGLGGPNKNLIVPSVLPSPSVSELERVTPAVGSVRLSGMRSRGSCSFSFNAILSLVKLVLEARMAAAELELGDALGFVDEKAYGL